MIQKEKKKNNTTFYINIQVVSVLLLILLMIKMANLYCHCPLCEWKQYVNLNDLHIDSWGKYLRMQKCWWIYSVFLGHFQESLFLQSEGNLSSGNRKSFIITVHYSMNFSIAMVFSWSIQGGLECRVYHSNTPYYLWHESILLKSILQEDFP